MAATLALLLTLLVAPAVSAAEPAHRGRDRGRADVDVIVPLDPGQYGGTWWPHRNDRRLVPPTVSIGDAPYVCDLDALTFATRDAFVAHLRGEHLVEPARIPELLYRTEGEVHFTGE